MSSRLPAADQIGRTSYAARHGPLPLAVEGFTLIETLLASVAALAVFGATLGVLMSSLRVQNRDSEWSFALQEDRVGLARMVRDIRQATEIKTEGEGAIYFAATIGGKKWQVKYECGVTQAGAAYSYTQCLRLAAEVPNALPATGPVIARYLVNGSKVFSYSPGGAPTSVTVKLEMPAKGNLKQVSSTHGYEHAVVLEDAAFMRNRYLEG
jgi:type II secretory pathway pseudopilin PulG